MKADASTASAQLVARFGRQRPIRGGSLIVTLFGDAILPRGGAIALGNLIALTAPFGLNERLVRTAVSRLVHEGWLEAHRSGKLSEYRLSQNGGERFAEATRRIYSPPETPWSGRWTLVVIPPMKAADRKALREELVWRGFGELTTGVFAHPEIDATSLHTQRASNDPLSRTIVFDANLSEDHSPQRLVSLGWDLDDLAARYQRLVKRFERVHAALDSATYHEPEACFIIRTLMIHEYRRLHLRDPLLPPALLRDNWPGMRAAALVRDIYDTVFVDSEVHLSRVAARLDGPLPAPDAAIFTRFGGIAPRGMSRKRGAGD
jgi:phenylacetic acid degradation operon negative regulatory protein